eukprot:733768-Rhodomonas_salina.2
MRVEQDRVEELVKLEREQKRTGSVGYRTTGEREREFKRQGSVQDGGRSHLRVRQRKTQVVGRLRVRRRNSQVGGRVARVGLLAVLGSRVWDQGSGNKCVGSRVQVLGSRVGEGEYSGLGSRVSVSGLGTRV